jgi:hypothetical protein
MTTHLKIFFEISLFKKTFPKKTTNLQKFATKDKTKTILTNAQGRIIQLFNSKISPKYVSLTSTKVKCIVTLLEI